MQMGTFSTGEGTAAVIAPVITPAPTAIPYRRPTPVVLPTSLEQPPPRQLLADTDSGEGPNGYYNPGSRGGRGSGGDDDAVAERFEQAWKCVMRAARDALPEDHPFEQPIM